MRILVVGGGTGGHVTPAVAVVREVLEKAPGTQVEFWTDRKYYKNVVKITTELGVRWGEEAGNGTRKNPYIRVRKIAAGKFHRYANWRWKDYFKYFNVVLKDLIWGNIKGFFGFMSGLWQSFWRLLSRKKRPDVIFLKGGYVCLPVGMVAKWRGIPYVIHESDAVPGLANRLLMKDATVVAKGWKGEEKETQEDGQVLEVHTGIPVAAEFQPVDEAAQRKLKESFGFSPDEPLLVVTGGSQGALDINEAIREILPQLLEITGVGLVAGRKYYEEVVDLKKYEDWEKAKLKSNFRMWEFNSAMHELLGAADVVISRAGATTIAELAALEKAVILVPYERLPGGHQMKNARDLGKAGAVLVVENERMVAKPTRLLEKVEGLIKSKRERLKLARNLHDQAAPDAASRLATILIDVAKGGDMTNGELIRG